MAHGVALTEAALARALDSMRGAVLAAFPRGLPPWDPVRRGIEGAAQGQVRPLSFLLGGTGCSRQTPASALSGCICGSAAAIFTYIFSCMHMCSHTCIYMHNCIGSRQVQHS